MPRTGQAAVEAWKREHPDKYRKLVGENCGLQVRLEGVEYDHSQHKYNINLSPIKFLYYVSLQQRLAEPNLACLRREVFGNALSFLTERSQPLLPNHFALHMAIVSSDNKLLIRQRPDGIEIYPGRWEASIGEFMHGPKAETYPHFTEAGKPDLQMFCKNAVAEEINDKTATPEQFRVYGFGMEYRTLAPKIYVVHRSAKSMAFLLAKGKQAADPGKHLSSIDFHPRSLGKDFAPSSPYKWTPSSRIISLLALRESAENEDAQRKLIEEFKKALEG